MQGQVWRAVTGVRRVLRRGERAHNSCTLNIFGQAVNWPMEKLKWPHLADLYLCEATSEGIEVLLGADVFALIVPREVREGPAGSHAPGNDALHRQVERFWETDSFGAKNDSPPRMSKRDEVALEMLEANTVLRDGHYETGLLWRRPDIELPGNCAAAFT